MRGETGFGEGVGVEGGEEVEGGGFDAEDEGAEGEGGEAGGEEGGGFGWGEVAFGADGEGEGGGEGVGEGVEPGGDGDGGGEEGAEGGGGAVGPGRGGEDGVEGLRGGDEGEPGVAGLFAGGEGDGGPAGGLAGGVGGFDADDGVVGLHGDDASGAEFDGFLDDPVHFLLADKGLEEPEGGGGAGDEAGGEDAQADVLAVGVEDDGGCDASRAVQKFRRHARLEAHDGGEMVRFLLGKDGLGVVPEVRGEEGADHGKGIRGRI